MEGRPGGRSQACPHVAPPTPALIANTAPPEHTSLVGCGEQCAPRRRTASRDAAEKRERAAGVGVVADLAERAEATAGPLATRRAHGGDGGTAGEAAHSEQSAGSGSHGPKAHALGAQLVLAVPLKHRQNTLPGPVRRGRHAVQPEAVDSLRRISAARGVEAGAHTPLTSYIA
eukprot:65061-Pleurochrysis_carterae.AAC.1